MLATIMLILAYIWASAMTVFIMWSVIRWMYPYILKACYHYFTRKAHGNVHPANSLLPS